MTIGASSITVKPRAWLWGRTAARLEAPAPEVARLLLEEEADVLAFYAFLKEHWSKLRSTNPLERVNREIGRRTDSASTAPIR